jgi:hypothetical protein
MKISKVFGLFALANSIAGNYTSKFYEHGGRAVEYGSYGAKKFFETTENLGRCTKELGIYMEDQSQKMEKLGWNMFRDEDYRELTANCLYSEQELDNDWVLVSDLRTK